MPGSAKEVRLNGAALASGEELRSRLAALAFTPERLAVVKGGPIVRRAYLDRMLGRVFPSRAQISPTYGRAVAQRNAALRRVRAGRGRPRLRRALDGAGGDARDRARRRAVRAGVAPRARVLESRRVARPHGSSAHLRRSRPHRRGAGASGSPATSSERSPVRARTSATRRSPPAAASYAVSARRESSARPFSRSSLPRRSFWPIAGASRRFSFSTTSSASSTPNGAAPSSTQLPAARPDGDHRDAQTGRGRAGSDRRGHSRRGEGGGVRFGPLRPIEDEVRRELARFGPAAGLGDIVAAWPECVGVGIAANAWPARLARDGSLHVSTSSSAWAFELTQLASSILERLQERLGESAPGLAAVRAGPASGGRTGTCGSFGADRAEGQRGRSRRGRADRREHRESGSPRGSCAGCRGQFGGRFQPLDLIDFIGRGNSPLAGLF